MPEANSQKTPVEPVAGEATKINFPHDGTAGPSPATGNDTALALGSTFDVYRLEAKLGEGGMGAVYKAVHTKLHKTVAIKVLSSRVLATPETVSQFEREMKAVGRLDHPHIVRAMDAGEVNGIHYLAMEYVEGQDLQQCVRDKGPVSVVQACRAIRQAAQALSAARASGLIHRDIKPSNLLVTKKWQVKLLDLGLARLRDDREATTELTTEGQTFGTPDYMAPEQWEDAHSVDGRAYLYSLGCTLFYLLTGRAPYSTSQALRRLGDAAFRRTRCFSRRRGHVAFLEFKAHSAPAAAEHVVRLQVLGP